MSYDICLSVFYSLHLVWLSQSIHVAAGCASGKEPTFQCRRYKRCGFNPWVRRSPGEGHGNPLQYSCLENPHGQRSLANCSPWGRKELDTTEQLSTAHSTLSKRRHCVFHSPKEDGSGPSNCMELPTGTNERNRLPCLWVADEIIYLASFSLTTLSRPNRYHFPYVFPLLCIGYIYL